MDIIQLLPDSVANQIAAGEVIQRPSSVVKELVENAVDAGAKHIELLVVDAGRTSIMVVDDGKGMSETDARLAFERHATSKIRQASDLFALSTMGFRGEALPSIAAVSQVTLRTRSQDQPLGTVLCIEGGRVISQEIDACTLGSSFLVENLFFNVPARRKFLKSNQTELNNIIQEFERIALVNPDIQFTFYNNGALQQTYLAGSLRQRVATVFGKKFENRLLDVHVQTSLCGMEGFVGRPDSSRRRGVPQFFFVNSRYMRHPYFQKAVMTAFENYIPASEQVPFFLYLNVDPSTIDVNIHPTKTEIKFENEQAIWQIILAAVRESLGRFNAIPTIDFEMDANIPELPVFHSSDTTPPPPPTFSIDPNYNPFSPSSSRRGSGTVYHGWEQLYALESPPVMEQGSTAVKPLQEELFPQIQELHRSHEHYQYRGQYILTETDQGLMFTDQHRAHVRILYNRYMKQLFGKQRSAQQLLFPEVVTLSVSDVLILENILDDLYATGFEITILGEGSISVKSVPADLQGLALQGLFEDIVASLREGIGLLEGELHHRIALTMARRAAIPLGQVLSQAEMEQILLDLFLTDNPNLTPDGQTILVFMSQVSIAKMF